MNYPINCPIENCDSTLGSNHNAMNHLMDKHDKNYTDASNILLMHFERGLSFNAYQNISRETVRYSEHIHNADPEILFLGNSIAGEGGEINEKIKKYAREGNDLYLTDLDKEIGDLFWYLNRLADKLDVSFEEIASENLEKTHSRFERDKIHGEGDNR